jgi:hypothetical protein
MRPERQLNPALTKKIRLLVTIKINLALTIKISALFIINVPSSFAQAGESATTIE